VRFRRPRKPEAAVAEDLSAPPPAGLATKVLYAPVKIASRRVAPRLAARLFRRIWGAIDGDAPPPRAEEPQGSVAKLGLALALEGALSAIVAGLVDHVSRREFARLTGRWPGRRKK
jgi:hypothetical protein